MSMPRLPELLKQAHSWVLKAIRAGRLEDLTPRLVLRGLEEQYDMEEGALEGYKKQLKRAMREAVDEASKEQDAEAVATGEGVPINSPTPEPVKPAGRKARAPTKGKPSATTAPEGQDAVFSSPPATATRKTRKKKVIEESDDEGIADSGALTSPAPSHSKEQRRGKPRSNADGQPRDGANPSVTPPPKRRKISKEFVESDDDEDDPRAANGDAAEDATESRAAPASDNVAAAEASESEMSVLIDMTPVKKPRKGKEKAADNAPKEKKAAKRKGRKSVDTTERKGSAAKGARKVKEPTSKDEETIKRLKTLVAACGVRKAWVREFADQPKPSQQIAHLRAVLADLGLGPRAGMEQARAVRAKRELAKELADVQEFGSRHAGGRATSTEGEENKRAVKKRKKVVESDEESMEGGDGESDEDGSHDVGKRKPKGTARKSIAAFLADQSDDD